MDDVVDVDSGDDGAANCPSDEVSERPKFAKDEGHIPSLPRMGMRLCAPGGGPEDGPMFSTMFQRPSFGGAPGTCSNSVDIVYVGCCNQMKTVRVKVEMKRFQTKGKWFGWVWSGWVVDLACHIYNTTFSF